MSPADDATPLVTLSAPRRGVVTNVAGGIFLGALGIAAGLGVFVPYSQAESTGRLPLIVGAVLLITLAAFVVVRSPRLGVTLYADRAVVTGQFWSRSVPRDAIADVAPFPALIWRHANGRKHHTPINALNVWRDVDRAPAELRDEIAEKTHALIDWARAGDNAFARTPVSTDDGAHDTDDPFTALGL